MQSFNDDIPAQVIWNLNNKKQKDNHQLLAKKSYRRQSSWLIYPLNCWVNDVWVLTSYRMFKIFFLCNSVFCVHIFSCFPVSFRLCPLRFTSFYFFYFFIIIISFSDLEVVFVFCFLSVYMDLSIIFLNRMNKIGNTVQ